MARARIKVDLFVEDQGHENFCRALIEKISKDKDLNPVFNPRCVQGGHGVALTELKGFQRALEKEKIQSGSPDLLVVVIDANCHKHQDARREIDKIIKKELFPHSVIGCPDPHVERWYLADHTSLKEVFSKAPKLVPYKCERGYYKNALTDLIRESGLAAAQEGGEFSPDIVEAMDLYTSSKADPSLGSFIDELKAEINRLAGES